MFSFIILYSDLVSRIEFAWGVSWSKYIFLMLYTLPLGKVLFKPIIRDSIIGFAWTRDNCPLKSPKSPLSSTVLEIPVNPKKNAPKVSKAPKFEF